MDFNEVREQPHGALTQRSSTTADARDRRAIDYTMS
jgi:hypothetical protein